MAILLVSANDFFLTFFVITEPAPTNTILIRIVTGATNEEFEPINTLSFILVLLFFTPS